MSSFNYIEVDNSVVDFLSSESGPIRLQVGGMFICRSGEATVIIDMKTYRVADGSTIVIFPGTILRTISRSDDFSGFGLGVNMELIRAIQLPSATSYYLHIKENPCISVTQEETMRLTALCEDLNKRQKDANHPFRGEICDRLLMILCYEIVAIYQRRQPITHLSSSRGDQLFHRFLFLLATHCETEREVEFYAEQMCLTPRYLSAVIKDQSRKLPSKWIAEMVVTQAKRLLMDRNRTIQQIAAQLNFATPSFFTRYFRKHTGMTPTHFRTPSV